MSGPTARRPREGCDWVEARIEGRRVAIVKGRILGREREAQQQKGRFALNGSHWAVQPYGNEGTLKIASNRESRVKLGHYR